ncbi:MAG: hypothetical protein JNM24_11070 [Bdellovibrionaceae bacterium]|nr:hypothetical protein [Pseudobdellovibrionaceae bacterium]
MKMPSVKIINLSVAMAMAMSLSACDVRNELKDMHKSTGNMEKNTEKMVEITDRMEKMTQKMSGDVEGMKQETKDVNDSVVSMGKKMDEVNSSVSEFNGKIDKLHGVADSLEKRVGTGIEETYDGLRQGDSSQLRRVAFQGLLNARAHEKKLLEAAQYLAGFEFYFWRGFGMDADLARREELVAGAAQQFYKDIYEIYNYKASVFPMADPDLGEGFNREASFNAIAAALHMDNPKQKENIRLMANKGIKVEDLSFLKIIKAGLMAKINVEDRKLKLEDVPAQYKEVMINEEISIKLLQARWNFLAVAALDKSFHFKQNGAFKYVRSAWNLATTWKLDFSKLNTSQIADQHFYLKEAQSARAFLNSIGVETKPDMLLVAFINRMRPTNIDKLSAENRVKVEECLQILESLSK